MIRTQSTSSRRSASAMATPSGGRFATAALLVALVVLAAACGGDDDPTVASDETASPEGESTPAEEEATPSEPDTDSTAAECPTDAPLPEDTDRHGAVAVESGSVELDASDQFFDPTCVTGVSGDTVSLTITNTGQALHNIQIEDQDLDEDISPGETVTVDVEVGSEPVAFTCKYHSSLGMHGAVVPQG